MPVGGLGDNPLRAPLSQTGAPGRVRYSTKPLATEAWSPCAPQGRRDKPECELIGAPTALEGPELEGSGHNGGLNPQDLRSAYKLPEHGGAGSTIVVVEAPSDASAEADLNVYRKEYGLSECTEANGCFEQLNAYGERKKPAPPKMSEAEEAWAAETSLDLDMASAACSECHLILVEALEETNAAMLVAEEEAVRLNPTAISNSWSFGFEKGNPANSNVNCEVRHCVTHEQEEAYDPYFNHKGTPFFFSGGDYGYAVRYPAASQYVISVGGTALTKTSEGSRGWSEQVWFESAPEVDALYRGSGSGCSLYEAKPKWQTDTACAKRLQNDVAADANPEKSPVSVYDSYAKSTSGWLNLGGTSLAAPLVAGAWAVAEPSAKGLQSMGAEAFYKDPSALFDITTGSNGTCAPPAEDEYWCVAKSGYDGPSGNGTPNGLLEVGRAPVVSTKAAGSLSSTGATLRGTVNPMGLEASYHFEYGTTTAYGTSIPQPAGSAGSGMSAKEVSQALSGLKPETTYHFRLVGVNATGTSNGADESFTTPPLPAISNVQANAGPAGGGTEVAISGANLSGASQVKFGPTAASAITAASASLVLAVAPAGSGTVDITVTTPNGSSATSSADRFVYRSGGVASAWGEGIYGQLGTGSATNSSLPLPVSGSSEATALAAGGSHSLGVKAAGVVATGNNERGQLGTGTTTSSNTPLATCAEGEEAPCSKHLSEVISVAAGKSHSLALLKGGTIEAWGYNASGQLGDGKSNTTDTPVKVTGLTEEATQVVAGASFSMALMKGGGVMAWGGGGSGQLGNGKTSGSNKPAPVCLAVEESGCKSANRLGGVVAIAAGGSHALALLKNGTVMAWGENKYGQLGNGSTTNSPLPVAVTGLSGATAIAAGENTSLALRASGGLSAWGDNEAGELGNGSSSSTSTAAEVPGLAEVTAIAAGGAHELAQLRNGSVMAWGENSQGQLGNGASSGPESCTVAGTEGVPCAKSPAPVANLSAVAAIAAGAHHSIALAASPAPTVTHLAPAEGLLAGGTTVAITGTNFTGTSGVRFGATAATSFSVNSATSITAVAPAGNGIVPVTVTNAAGTSAAVAASQYSYLIPSLLEGLPFKSTIEEGKEIQVALPSEGRGFSFGSMTMGGAVGETAKLNLESRPGFEMLETAEYAGTGHGIFAQVEGMDAKGSKIVGPVEVACSAPTSITVAEISIVASPTGGRKKTTTSFNAECVLTPGIWNIVGQAKVTVTVNAPEGAAPGESIEPGEASFTVSLPKEWSSWFYHLGGRSARGTSMSRAASSIVP